MSHIDLGFTYESFDEMKYLIEKDLFNEDDDDDDPPTENETLLNDLRHWHLSSPSNTSSSTTSLLKILRKHPGLSFLPSDVRSVKSMRKVVTIPMEPGHYYHFGLRFALHRLLDRYPAHSLPSTLSLAANMDGLPLSKSSRSELWGILCRCINLRNSQVFVVGMYHGETKPKDPNLYLREFVEEALIVLSEGICIKSKKITVVLSLFACDTPALAFILLVAYQTAYYSCLQCTTKGHYYRINRARAGRVTFPQLNAPLRSDESFRNQSQAKHHRGRSILERLGIDKNRAFPNDPFHLFFLGATRQMLVNLLIRCPNQGVKMQQFDIDKLDDRLLSLKRSNVIPVDFPRTPRSVKELGRWKGSELKQFAKYTSVVLLRGLVSPVIYDHFLVFHVGLRLVHNVEAVSNRQTMDYCKQLFKNFIDDAKKIYGQQFICNNAHKLYHFPDDAFCHGVAQNLSTEPFENFLQIVKNLCATSALPLQQIVKRLNELLLYGYGRQESEENSFISVSDRHFDGPILPQLFGEQFRCGKFNNWDLKTSVPNNCVLLDNLQIVLIENFVRTATDIFITGRAYKEDEISDFFPFPCPSSTIGTYEVRTLKSEMECFSLRRVKSKCIRMPSFKDDNSYVVSTLDD